MCARTPLERGARFKGVSVMADWVLKIFFLVLVFSLSACAKKSTSYFDLGKFGDQPCSFVEQHNGYEVSDAPIDALEKFRLDDFHLIRVGDGFGPSTPGLKVLNKLNDNETRCLGVALQNGEDKILMVGADHEFCRERAELSKKAWSYANSFNQTMLVLMIEKGLNNCEYFKKKPH